MSLPPAEIQDRFRAALLGFAIGDALGFPIRGVPRASLGRLPGLGDDFSPRPRGRFARGQFSDDTQLMLATAESVILERKLDGRSLGAHLASLWREGVLLYPPQSVADAADRLLGGVPWMSAGATLGVRDAGALSRALVVGLWDAEAVTRIGHDAAVATVVTHKDPLCAAASAAYARAVALGLEDGARSPAAFCDAVASCASVHDSGLADELRQLPRLLSWDVQRALEQLRCVGVPPSQLREEDGLPSHVVPVLLVALYAALRVPHDYRQAVLLVLRCGGEADAAAAACGGLLGAHLGEAALPSRLRRGVLYGDHLSSTADRLYQARQGVPAPAAAVVSHARRR